MTTKVMVAGLKAIHYPVAHPKKLRCRGLGTAVKGRHTSFRCVATLKAHKQRRFFTRAVKGGWICVGKKRSRCALLSHGYFPASAAASLRCTGIESLMTCTLKRTPAVTVILTYQKAGTGYVETASLRPH